MTMSFTSKYTSIFFPCFILSTSSSVNSIFDIISSAVSITFALFEFGVSDSTNSTFPGSIITKVNSVVSII